MGEAPGFVEQVSLSVSKFLFQ